MKLLISFAIAVMLAAPLPAQTPTPGSTEAQAQAREELNAAAWAYHDGKFAEAQAHSERALQLDPENKTAPFFVARTIHAQYKPGIFTPENVAKAREAIAAYRRILERVPDNDEAYKAIAFLYGAIKDDELLREWLLQRARDASFANEQRAEAYTALASKDWDCSFKITELPANKLAVAPVRGNRAYVRYRMPQDRTQFERARECAKRGLEMANMGVTLAPENESAWSYKTNLLLELSKLAEMSGQIRQQRELRRQYEAALVQTTKLMKPSPPNP